MERSIMLLILVLLQVITISQGFMPVYPSRMVRSVNVEIVNAVRTASSQTIMQRPSSSFSMQMRSVRADDEDDDEEEGEETGRPATTDAPDISSISLVKEGVNFSSVLNGSDVRVGIIATRWNNDIISGLAKGVNESLTAAGVKPSNIFTTYVPGAFEIPLTAKFLAMSKRFDVIICLGCVIKGETMHFEYICQAASTGIMQVQLETLVPMIFGVLTVLDKEQAIVRSTGTKNEGLSWGKTAVEMALARMQALGIGKPTEKTPGASAFVTFEEKNATSTATPAEKPKPKPFGF